MCYLIVRRRLSGRLSSRAKLVRQFEDPRSVLFSPFTSFLLANGHSSIRSVIKYAIVISMLNVTSDSVDRTITINAVVNAENNWTFGQVVAIINALLLLVAFVIRYLRIPFVRAENEDWNSWSGTFSALSIRLMVCAVVLVAFTLPFMLLPLATQRVNELYLALTFVCVLVGACAMMFMFCWLVCRLLETLFPNPVVGNRVASRTNAMALIKLAWEEIRSKILPIVRPILYSFEPEDGEDENEIIRRFLGQVDREDD